jgi:hypothetical protein
MVLPSAQKMGVLNSLLRAGATIQSSAQLSSEPLYMPSKCDSIYLNLEKSLRAAVYIRYVVREAFGKGHHVIV